MSRIGVALPLALWAEGQLSGDADLGLFGAQCLKWRSLLVPLKETSGRKGGNDDCRPREARPLSSFPPS